MANVLIFSSQVTRGYVGGSAQRVIFERLGYQAWLLPTIQLSSHPGHATFSGHVTPPDALASMVQALDQNGWLGDVAAVVTGYMPSAEHAAVTAGAVKRVRDQTPWALHLSDPAMGDAATGLYVEESAAEAIKLDLLPQADIATPNHFELEWLSGQAVTDLAGAAAAERALGPARVLVTSAPMGRESLLGNLLISGNHGWLAHVTRRAHAPHGTGDAIAGLFLAHLVRSDDPEESLALSCAGIEAMLDASSEADELQLVTSPEAWSGPKPWSIEPFKD